MDKSNVGIAGEYFVLAQLAQRGLVITMTLSHTKSIDILVTNEAFKTLYKVEVKTTQKKPLTEKLFGKKPFYCWTMSEKHEQIKDPRLFYCFVHLSHLKELPRFFIVPSRIVARYVKWQHNKWLKSRKRQIKDTTMRRYRIPIDDPAGYGDNWDVFFAKG